MIGDGELVDGGLRDAILIAMGLTVLCLLTIPGLQKHSRKIRHLFGPDRAAMEIFLLRIVLLSMVLCLVVLSFCYVYTKTKIVQQLTLAAPFLGLSLTLGGLWVFRFLRYVRREASLASPKQLITYGRLGYDHWMPKKRSNGKFYYIVCLGVVVFSVRQGDYIYLLAAVASVPVYLSKYLDSKVASLVSPDALLLFGSVTLPKVDLRRVSFPPILYESKHIQLLEIETLQGELFRIPFEKNKLAQLTDFLKAYDYPLRAADGRLP